MTSNEAINGAQGPFAAVPFDAIMGRGKRFAKKTEAKKKPEHRMKRFLLGAIALVAMSVAAPAADLPAYTKAPPVMMPALYD